MGILDAVNAVLGDELAIAGHRFDWHTNQPDSHRRNQWV